jgi:hypothetical protein
VKHSRIWMMTVCMAGALRYKEVSMFVRIVRIVALLSLAFVPSAIAQAPPDSAAAQTPPAAPAQVPPDSVAIPAPPAAAGQTDHAAAVKQSLQQSMAALRQYQWIETTVVSMKGEEKSRTQNNCVYGADGNVQKTPLAAPAQDEKKKKGLRGKIVENKKEDVSEATKEAVGLVKQYVPPDPARIQAAKEAGRLAVTPPDAAGKVRMVIRDYLKTGDSLTLDVNAASDRISGLSVATFTEKKDPVGLKVSFGAFADGTVYPANVQLDIASQKMAIAIDNTGYKKVGS